MNAAEGNELNNARAHLLLAIRVVDELAVDEFHNLDHAIADLQKAFFSLGRLKHLRFGWVHLRPDATIPEPAHA